MLYFVTFMSFIVKLATYITGYNFFLIIFLFWRDIRPSAEQKLERWGAVGQGKGMVVHLWEYQARLFPFITDSV